jgi:hypothetical protein
MKLLERNERKRKSASRWKDEALDRPHLRLLPLLLLVRLRLLRLHLRQLSIILRQFAFLRLSRSFWSASLPQKLQLREQLGIQRPQSRLDRARRRQRQQ